VNADGDSYITIKTLKPQQFSYSIDIDGIVNPGSGRSVSTIECATCKTTACDTFVEEYTRNRLSFSPITLPASNVEVVSDNMQNGAEKTTLSYEIIIGNPLLANGIVNMIIPKQNYWFIPLGAPSRECMLMDCDDTKLTVKAYQAASRTAST
jgi:hypothetical protein